MLYGRGACDAKGILAAQVAAAERLRAKGETRIGLVFVGGEERGSDGAKAANRIASKIAIPDQRRADGSAPRRGDARLLPRAAHRVGQGGALRLSGARRIGDRKADGLPGGAALRRLAVGSAARQDALHGWPDQRRRRAERDSAERGSRGVLSHGRRSRAAARNAAPDAGRPRRRRGDPRAAGDPHAHRGRLRDRGVLVFQRHSVPGRSGARRCCSGRGRSTSRTPIASTSRSTSSIAPSMSTNSSPRRSFRRRAKVCQTKGSARNLGNLRAANRVRAGRQQR